MAKNKTTKEEQYNALFDEAEEASRPQMGLMSNHTWATDPKRLLFVMSRYKFVSRMLEGCGNVLEVGCADAFGTRIVQQTTKSVTALDFDPIFVDDVKKRLSPNWPLKTSVHNMLDGPAPGANYDGAYALDVLEHIDTEHEAEFVKNICNSISESGILIIGMPSLESQKYASTQSKIGHVNCKTGSELRECLNKSFNVVLVFSMNDEVVHTGFHPMAHYLLAVCCHKK